MIEPVDETAERAPGAGFYALMLAMPLFFASNLVIGRVAVQEVPPATLAFWRWAIAFGLLLPFGVRPLLEHRRAIVAEWRRFVLLGTLGMFVSGYVVYLGLGYTTATNATLIYATSPILVVLIEARREGRSIAPRRIGGIVLAVLGLLAVIFQASWARLLAFEFRLGDISILIGTVNWAIYSLALKSPRIARFPTAASFTAIVAVGVVTLIPAALYEGVTLHAMPSGAASWLRIAGLALMPSVLAFAIYQWGVRRLGPSTTSVYLYLMPIYGVGMSAVFLGEALHWYHTFGLVTVTAGVTLATWPGRATRAGPALS